METVPAYLKLGRRAVFGKRRTAGSVLSRVAPSFTATTISRRRRHEVRRPLQPLNLCGQRISADSRNERRMNEWNGYAPSAEQREEEEREGLLK